MTHVLTYAAFTPRPVKIHIRSRRNEEVLRGIAVATEVEKKPGEVRRRAAKCFRLVRTMAFTVERGARRIAPFPHNFPATLSDRPRKGPEFRVSESYFGRVSYLYNFFFFSASGCIKLTN